MHQLRVIYSALKTTRTLKKDPRPYSSKSLRHMTDSCYTQKHQIPLPLFRAQHKYPVPTISSRSVSRVGAKRE